MPNKARFNVGFDLDNVDHTQAYEYLKSYPFRRRSELVVQAVLAHSRQSNDNIAMPEEMIAKIVQGIVQNLSINTTIIKNSYQFIVCCTEKEIFLKFCLISISSYILHFFKCIPKPVMSLQDASMPACMSRASWILVKIKGPSGLEKIQCPNGPALCLYFFLFFFVLFLRAVSADVVAIDSCIYRQRTVRPKIVPLAADVLPADERFPVLRP